jgi:HEAT repeat protein
MDLLSLLNDKAIKAKAKTEIICDLLLKNNVSQKDLAASAEKLKDPAKATCIEALEFATKQKPAIIDKAGFRFVTASLTSKAPRVKWESAKVIGNTAHLFKEELGEPIKKLLANTEDEGTVVRWSAAFALGEIVKLKTRHNKTLVPAIEAICNSEEKNSIKKIYLDAVKKLN